MTNTKLITIGGLLTGLAVLFQIIPALFSEAFIPITMLSALPIYIIARLNPKTGLIAFAVAGILIMAVTTHEGLFFLFTNGPVGLSLGMVHHFTAKKLIILLGTSLVLTFTLSIMNFVIGIHVFGTKIPGVLWVQLVILYLFSFVYIVIYFHLANFLFNLLNKLFTLEGKS